MNVVGTLLNILKNRLYMSTLLASILFITSIIVLKNYVFIPLFKKELTNNILEETKRISLHLSRTIDIVNTKKNNIEIKRISKEFGIKKLHYFSKDATIVFSTEKEKIGKNYKNNLPMSIINKGNISSKIIYAKEPMIKGEALLPPHIENYVPIKRQNNIIGIFKFYYDITDKLNVFNRNIEQVNLYVNLLNSIFLIIVFYLLYFSNNNKLKNVEYQKELERLNDILNETNGYIYAKDLDGCYTFANKLVLNLFNISAKELMGKNDFNVFDLKTAEELRKNDTSVMKENKLIKKEEQVLLKETNEIKIYWSVKKPLYDKKGIIIGMTGISVDITERKKLEKELNEQKEFLNIILNNVDAYISIKDEKRKFRYANANTAELFGKVVEDVIGKQDSEFLPKEIADKLWESDKSVFDTNEKIATEVTIKDTKGQIKHYWSIKVPYTLNEEKLVISFSSDITEIHILKEKLKKEVITDSLTNLYNKRHFNLVALTEFKRSKRQNIVLSLIIIDIDYFKQINDRYGHNIGDIVLTKASQVFQSLIRQEDTLCRIGGEEFAIILPCTSLSKSIVLAERIRIFTEEQVFKLDEAKKVSITISLGVSSMSPEDKKYEDILMRADKALYQAKKISRNRVVSL